MVIAVIAFTFIVLTLNRKSFHRGKLFTLGMMCATLAASWTPALAGTTSSTTTTLAVTAAGVAATSVSSGSVVALTASVQAGTAAVTVGLVNFCDASATYCTDVHILGTAQLTSAGTAVFKFRPGNGNHSYKAVFAGTNAYDGSASSSASLTVTGTAAVSPATTSIAESGSWGSYTLTGTVTGLGGTSGPTGTVSFLDASNGNAVLGTGTLGSNVTAIGWPSPLGLTTSSGSQAVAVGDFNGDGIPDLAVVGDQTYSPLVILLGSANGTYTAAPKSIVPAFDFHPLVTADFNGDGKLDIAGLSNDSETAIVLLGNGDGTFIEAASSPAVGDLAGPLAVGDFNADGIPDLAVGESSSIQIFLGNGDGTFIAASGKGPVTSLLTGLVVGDFNGDGKLDLAFADGLISVALGNGDGTFGARINVSSINSDSPLVAADLNGDGKLDLAVASASPTLGANDSLTVLTGNGDGTFTPPNPLPLGESINISSIQVGDLNGDGIPDLVVTNSGVGTFTAFLAKGDGTFIAFPTSVSTGSFHQLASAVGDLNGDGRTDVLIASADISTVLVYLTEPTQTATATSAVLIAGVGQHQVLASYAGDSNYTSSASNSLGVWGTPPATTTTLALTSGGAPTSSVAPGTVVSLIATVMAGTSPVATGKVDFCDASADSCTDIHLLGSAALTANGTATFKYGPGSGVHSYKAQFVQNGYGLRSSSTTSPLTVGPAPAAVYSDTTAIAYSGSPGDYSLTATVVGVGGPASPTGNVSFLDTSFGNATLATAPLGTAIAGLGWHILQTPAAAGNPTLEVTADFNGDGVPDLAVLSADVNNSLSYETCTIFFGKGDGTFVNGPATQTHIGAASGFAPYMVGGDFNADGKMDLAILNYPDIGTADTVTTLLGKGDGTFTVSAASVVYNPGSVAGDGVPGSMVAADFNGDGKLDLAVAGDYITSGGVTIVLGNGDGTFTALTPNIDVNGDFARIATGDFNGDGIPDLVATNFSEDGKAPAIFLGKGDGTFITTAASFTLDYFAASIAVGDFNGDGILDLAFSDLNGVDIALGKGDGTFTKTSASPIAVRSELYSLVVGDFNHDGKADLAGVDNFDTLIDLLIGAGDGTFIDTPAPVASPNLLNSFALVAADFNQDGTPDLAMLTKNTTTATILLTEPTQTATATVNAIAPVGAGTHNVEASYAGDANYSPTVSTAIALTAGLAPVVITPASGTYTSVQTVTLSEPIPGATIYYSASGTVNTNGFVPYTSPIQLTGGGPETLQAYATETGYQQSNTTTANYYLNLPVAPPPAFSLAAGNYAAAQSVTISDSVPGATFYYTTNGSSPTTNSTLYTGPIAITTSQTIVAIAVASGYTMSGPANAQYIIASSPSSFIYTLAGNGFSGYSGDAGPATSANLNQPSSSIADSQGNIYIADSYNNVIRKVAAGTGIISTLAGTGISGYSGDNGPATSARLNYPTGLALDGAGDLYFADENNSVVRMVAAATGLITTVAGNGIPGYAGDGSTAANAELYYPAGTAVDSSGNLYIVDSYNCRIRKVAAATGTIATVAGNGVYGYAGDGGPATAAEFYIPQGIAVDAVGNLYIADTSNQVVRKVTASTGVISTVAGSYPGFGHFEGSYSGDGGPATSATLNRPQAVTLDGSGNLFIADYENQVIREVAANNGVINTIVGNGPTDACSGLSGDGGPATSTAMCYPLGVSVDSSQNLYIADSGSGRVRLVTAAALPPKAATATPAVNIPAGTYDGPQTVTISDATPGASIYLTTDGTTPTTTAYAYNGPINASGNVTVSAIAVAPGHLISAPVSAAYTITSAPAKVISTVAGTGAIGFAGAGGPAKSAQVGYIAALTSDGAGNLFFADTVNNVVWELTAATGNISIVAGNGTPGYGGDGGPATSANLYYPNGVAVDSAGNLYIADTVNNLVRRVDSTTGLIETFAGHYGIFGGGPSQDGDGGPATAAYLNYPLGLAVDAAGNLYIADTFNNEVRVVSATTGIITSFAGNGNDYFSGEGGPAASASLGQPNALAFDNAGNLYIASYALGRVCKVISATGVLTTVAGNGNAYGTSGDGGPALNAEVYPLGLALDAPGNLYLANSPGDVREVSANSGIITKVVGNGYPGYSGDGGSATAAQLQLPAAIAFDASGNLYIADSGNYRIREVSTPAATTPPVITPPSGTYASVQTATITDSSSNAAIYYTTDGTTPTNASTVYGGPIAISATTNLQAIAIAPGLAQSTVASAAYTIQLPVAPAVTATPSAVSITTAQSLTVTVGVSGPENNPIPTGSVTLTSGGYSAQQNLASGAATFNIIAGVLPVGTNTLTVNYTPDAAGGVYYTTAKQAATVTVTPAIGTAAATMTLAPSATTITDKQPVSLAVSIAGTSGQATPTGTVTLAAGPYSASQPLSSGVTTFSIPPGAINEGANTLTANYFGDIIYAAASRTTTVTVAPVVATAPVPPPVAPGSSDSVTATFSAGTTYSGTMTLTCNLIASPPGAQSPPTCSLNPATITLASGGTASTVVTVNTTAASSGSALLSPTRHLWKALSGGGMITLALLFGVPSWRRRKTLAIVLLWVAVTTMIGCGAGGGSTTPPPSVTPATTAGAYMFSVVGTDSSNPKISASLNLNVTVQ